MSIKGWSTRSNRFGGGFWLAFLALALGLAVATPAVAGTPYDAGRMRIGLGLGRSTFLDSPYTIAGASFGYYFIDGLELNAAGSFWFGGSRAIGDLSPGVRFVLFFVPTIQPYVGAFYRHQFIEDYADQDSLGGNAGLLYSLGNGFIGGGVVYERVVSQCEGVCDATYPELVIALSF
jgi:hypothetical protein